jgi:hypothetical protein
MFWPQRGAGQSLPTATKIFCPQCGFENKSEARFCPQCGSSLPKREPMVPEFSLSSPTLTISASKIDSTEPARRELVRAVVADPEFNRLLQQRIQNAVNEAAMVQLTKPVAKPKANPVGAFFSIIGGLTCTVLFVGLMASL